jgi:hypothetical protein
MLLGSMSVKAVSKTLMKLTPGLNFIKVLRTAFTPVAPQSAQSSCQYLFTLLGTTSVKAVLRTLMKLTIGGWKRKKRVREMPSSS